MGWVGLGLTVASNLVGPALSMLGIGGHSQEAAPAAEPPVNSYSDQGSHDQDHAYAPEFRGPMLVEPPQSNDFPDVPWMNP